jgi:hypothetical protein
VVIGCELAKSFGDIFQFELHESLIFVDGFHTTVLGISESEKKKGEALAEAGLPKLFSGIT